MIDEDTRVRATLYCEYCGFSAMHTGPAFEVAEFLRAIALAHVTSLHPDKVPAGDVDLCVLRDLGFS